jgi:hypothetical protein
VGFFMALQQLAIVLEYDAVDDGQAQAGAVGLPARRVQTGEGAQQAFAFALRHARAMVKDVHHHLMALDTAAYVDFRAIGAGRLAVAACVLDQVAEDARQFRAIARDLGGGRNFGVILTSDRRADLAATSSSTPARSMLSRLLASKGLA